LCCRQLFYRLGFVNNDIAIAQIIGVINKILDVRLAVMQFQARRHRSILREKYKVGIVFNLVQIILQAGGFFCRMANQFQ
jgi:uncharacterized YccA/Bax inhibitor family protein